MSYALQSVLRQHYDSFQNNHHVSYVQDKAANAIIRCRTPALGANSSTCEDCGHVHINYNSCRNRNCNCCQTIPKEKWIDKRRAETLDETYFHVVFTVPEELNPIIYANQSLLYNLMYRASADTLLELGRDKKYLGAKIGFLSILHTWGQNLSYHPHIHCIVLGGGLTPDLKFVRSGKDFLFPVRVVSRLFRGKFMAAFKALYDNGSLVFSGTSKKFRDPAYFKRLISLLYKKEWIPHLKKTFENADNVIKYLGEYTYKVAISNSRIIGASKSEISFKYKDYRTGKHSVMTLKPEEFIRRFLMHVPPSGFVRIRYYGLLANRYKEKLLTICRVLTRSAQRVSQLTGLSTAQVMLTLYGIDISVCSECGSNKLIPRIHARLLE